MQNNRPFRTENIKPTFDVPVPFLGVYTIRCNAAWAAHMQNLINEFEDVEPEIAAFRDALNDPITMGCNIVDDNREPSFSIEKPYRGVIVIKMNEPMRDLLIDFITEESADGGVDNVTWAFSKALIDPVNHFLQQRAKMNDQRRQHQPRRRRYHGGARNYNYDQPSQGSNQAGNIEDDVVDD